MSILSPMTPQLDEYGIDRSPAMEEQRRIWAEEDAARVAALLKLDMGRPVRRREPSAYEEFCRTCRGKGEAWHRDCHINEYGHGMTFACTECNGSGVR